MAKYKLMGDGVLDTENNEYLHERCAGWQAYLTWTTISGNVADPEFTEQEADDRDWADLRIERDLLLSKTDFMMTQDFYHNKMTAQQQADVVNYRESLRNLPANTTDPSSPLWPTKPQIVIDQGV